MALYRCVRLAAAGALHSRVCPPPAGGTLWMGCPLTCLHG